MRREEQKGGERGVFWSESKVDGQNEKPEVHPEASCVTEAGVPAVTPSRAAQTCSSSSHAQRPLSSCSQSCLKFLNRWISPLCLPANWLYLGCSMLRPQPSLPSFCSYHFEEVHNKFPLFEPAGTESAQRVWHSPCCPAADGYACAVKAFGVQVKVNTHNAFPCCRLFHLSVMKKKDVYLIKFAAIKEKPFLNHFFLTII